MSIDQYNLDNTPEQEEDNKRPGLKTLFVIMGNPVEGWKKLRRMHTDTESISGRIFYPLGALAAVSVFANLFYDSTATLQSLLINAVITFVSFFLGYFIVIQILKLFLPKNCKDIAEDPFLKQIVMISLSSMEVFFTIYSLLPMLQPVLVFLPLWTIYLITKGGRFLKIPAGKTASVTGLISIAVAGSPLLISWFFELILPA